MLKITKQDIDTLDLSELNKLQLPQQELWCENNRLNRFESWLLPQLVSRFGMWELKYTTSKQIDVFQTLKYNCSDPKQLSYYHLTRVKRSSLLSRMTQQPQYGTLTPLILLAFKQYQGVPYSRWQHLENLEHILEPRLYTAITSDVGDLSGLLSLGSDRLLEIRQQGLTTRSGLSAGSQKPAETTWQLTGIKDTEIGHLPKLTQTILTQIWLAHPRHRSPNMILDITNWDNIPAPLFPVDIFSPSKANNPEKEVKTQPTTLPWM